jgi:hypothetical protein
MAKTNGSKSSGKKVKGTFTSEEWTILEPILAQNPPIIELPVEVINIDFSYQDRPRERIINQIATDFHEALLSVLKISQRPDGTYWAADGATRILGLLRMGDKHRLVRCEVFQTEGRRAEALLFAWFNSKRSKEPIKLETNLQAYNIAGTDGGFGKAVEECGYHLTGSGKRRLNGPGYVLKAWNLDGDGTAMKKTLFALRDAWKDNFKVYGYLVLGVAQVYHYPRKTVDEQVRRLLKRNTPDEIWEWAVKRYTRSGGKARIHPDARPDLITRAIIDQINKNPGNAGKIDINRMEWRTTEAQP